MLDLIVLGIVPGTSFVITLWWAVLFALICAVLFLVYIESTKPKRSKSMSRTGNRPAVDLGSVNALHVLNPIFHIPGRNLLLGRNHKD